MQTAENGTCIEQPFNDLPSLAQEGLRQLADKLSCLVPLATKVWNVSTRDLKPTSDDPAVVAEVRQWADKDSAFLYYFTVENNVDPNIIERAYSGAKAREKDERAYARLLGRSKYLYVGGSQNVTQRLREHLGFGAKQTYALQLLHWAPTLNVELCFTCAKYPNNVDVEVLQALEDALWVQLRPMFGRKGQR